jgi:predicted permease
MGWRSWRTRDADLNEEIRAHLDMAARDRMDRGERPTEARAAARREFGNIELVKEVTRDMWGRRSFERFGQDARFGLRLMGRSPGVAAAVILSLALGIGANTAIFSVMHALLWRRLPVPRATELVRFAYSDEGEDGSMFSYPGFATYRDHEQVFSSIAAIADLDRSNITIGAGQSTEARVALVSGPYFTTFGVGAARGRTFDASEDSVPGGHAVAVISDAYWTRAFNRATDIVGRAFALNGVTYAIVGVTPKAFAGDWVGQPVDAWIPMAMTSQVIAERPGLLTNPAPAWVRIVARVRPDVPRAQAQAAVDTLFMAGRGPSLAQAATDPRLTAEERAAVAAVHLTLAPLETGFSPERQLFTEPLVIVGVIVGLVLLITCSNVANLLLARALTRRREMAVRLALGAAAARLVRQLFTESLLLAALGGVSALAVAWWGTRALASALASGLTGLTLNLVPDLPVFGFAAGLSILTGVLFGLTPALIAAGTRLSAELSARSEGGQARLMPFAASQALVVAQVAVSLLLVVGAGLFVRTLANLRSQDLGFERRQVLLVWVPASEEGIRGLPVARVFEAAQDRIGALPGVLSASPSSDGLLNGGGGSSPIVIPGHTRTDDEGYFVRWNLVAPKFFQTVGLKLLAGRDFTVRDVETAPRVAIINESMARHYFGVPNPVGQRFGMRRDTGHEIEIVGVVADAATDSPREKGHRMIYIPYRQDLSHLSDMCLAVRATGDPTELMARIRAELRAIDSNLPVSAITSMNEQLDRALARERLVAGLAASFGVVATVLTCVGLYGVIAYGSARRTHEIGIRLALGATRGSVIGLVLRSAALLAGAGVAIGVPLVLSLTRFVSGHLFGIAATDPLTIGLAAGLMLAVALVAALVPARRAAGVDPMTALRAD